jgi:hypothetical protein
MTEAERLLIHAAISESIACRREGRPYDPRRLPKQMTELSFREAAIEAYREESSRDVRRIRRKRLSIKK